uniref:Uncharacterized protein n=1 Tax=Anguilla anguilla TaxID=7936 RepID=A0A0E9VTN4_ANGAN
MRKFIIDLQL